MQELLENKAAKIIEAGTAETAQVFGTTVQILLTGAETEGRYCTYEVTVPPGGGAPPHVHVNEDESFYVLEGRFEIMHDGQVTEAGVGSYVFLPKGVAHTFRNIGDTPGRLAGLAVPAGHEAFFRDADALVQSGEFGPEKALEVCQRHGITLLV